MCVLLIVINSNSGKIINYQATNLLDRWSWLFQQFGFVRPPVELMKQFFPIHCEIRFQPKKIHTTTGGYNY